MRFIVVALFLSKMSWRESIYGQYMVTSTPKIDFEIMMVVIVSNLARCEWYIGAIGGLAAPDKQGAGLIRQLRWCLLVVEGSRQALKK